MPVISSRKDELTRVEAIEQILARNAGAGPEYRRTSGSPAPAKRALRLGQLVENGDHPVDHRRRQKIVDADVMIGFGRLVAFGILLAPSARAAWSWSEEYPGQSGKDLEAVMVGTRTISGPERVLPRI